jgi:hypothetical protein
VANARSKRRGAAGSIAAHVWCRASGDGSSFPIEGGSSMARGSSMKVAWRHRGGFGPTIASAGVRA